jgi:hypothetical protein
MPRFAKHMVLASAFCLVLNTVAYSAGSYHKRAEFDRLVVAGVPHPQVTLPSLPQINPRYMFGGCGRGRIRDPPSHSCHGPGDISPHD